MDCEMPVVDGYEATRRLRALEREQGNRRLPVLALSAHILNDVKERCREAGMDGHLAKPVDLAELRNTLRIYAAR
jgi:CheY-like chemotaxis protein